MRVPCEVVPGTATRHCNPALRPPVCPSCKYLLVWSSHSTHDRSYPASIPRTRTFSSSRRQLASRRWRRRRRERRRRWRAARGCRAFSTRGSGLRTTGCTAASRGSGRARKTSLGNRLRRPGVRRASGEREEAGRARGSSVWERSVRGASVSPSAGSAKNPPGRLSLSPVVYSAAQVELALEVELAAKWISWHPVAV